MTTAMPSGRTAATALGAGALCWILVGIVHPHVGQQGDLIGQLARLSMHTVAVHAIAIAASGALLFGLAAYSLRRGIGRSAVLAALVASTIATFAIVAAGTIDGFVIARIAAIASSSPTAPPVSTTIELLRAWGVAVGAFTSVGFAAYAAAILLWSIDLVRDRGRLRAAGILGCTIFAAAIALMFASPHISSHTIVIVGLLQSVWYASIIALLAGNVV